MRKYGRLVKAALGDFYQSRVFTCRNTPVMFFNANAEKERAKCMQSNNSKCISAALVRAIGKSRLNRKKQQLF